MAFQFSRVVPEALMLSVQSVLVRNAEWDVMQDRGVKTCIYMTVSWESNLYCYRQVILKTLSFKIEIK